MLGRRVRAKVAGRYPWLRSGLFWRTFFLLAFLIAISMAVWVASFSVVERAPRANQIAAKVVSIVTITRAALTHSAPDLRRELLFDLASNEGLRIYTLEPEDRIQPPPNDAVMPEVEAIVKSRLGNSTRFAGSVNDMQGFWVSFQIDQDAYWLMLDRDPLETSSPLQMLGLAMITLLMSLIGAVFISRLINLPLARLTAAARTIARGETPPPLPEVGPQEIRQANRSFNQMVDDLNRIESDRAVILAGISHDLRTPITRMVLEIEMASLPDESRQGVLADLAQMDAIIGQFLDYARPADITSVGDVDLSNLLTDATHDAARFPEVHIKAEIADGIRIKGNTVELRRLFANLVENARRYGKTGDSGIVDLSLLCRMSGEQVIVEFSDQGPGITGEDIERLLRPFTRADEARGQANGAGLGLAIVDRIVKRHGGTVKLSNREGGGLVVTIALPR